MVKQAKKGKNRASRNRGFMFAYGFIQLGTSIISSISLAFIALSLYSFNIEKKAFRQCFYDSIEAGKTRSESKAFCNLAK